MADNYISFCDFFFYLIYLWVFIANWGRTYVGRQISYLILSLLLQYGWWSHKYLHVYFGFDNYRYSRTTSVKVNNSRSSPDVMKLWECICCCWTTTVEWTINRWVTWMQQLRHFQKETENSIILETLLMAILLYFIMLLYFVSYYLYSNVYGFTLYVSYIMLSHHWLGCISQILMFKPNILLLLLFLSVHIRPWLCPHIRALSVCPLNSVSVCR